jgi:hypothetical protein
MEWKSFIHLTYANLARNFEGFVCVEYIQVEFMHFCRVSDQWDNNLMDNGRKWASNLQNKHYELKTGVKFPRQNERMGKIECWRNNFYVYTNNALQRS